MQTHTEMLTLLRTPHAWAESVPVHHMCNVDGICLSPNSVFCFLVLLTSKQGTDTCQWINNGYLCFVLSQLCSRSLPSPRDMYSAWPVLLLLRESCLGIRRHRLKSSEIGETFTFPVSQDCWFCFSEPANMHCKFHDMTPRGTDCKRELHTSGDLASVHSWGKHVIWQSSKHLQVLLSIV